MVGFWQWLAAIGAAICVATVLFFCCVMICRRSSSSYEVSKAVMSQQAPELTAQWRRASVVSVFYIDRSTFRHGASTPVEHDWHGASTCNSNQNEKNGVGMCLELCAEPNSSSTTQG